MAKQTAVEWLLKYIEPSLTAEQTQFFSIVIPQSKEMEKQQMIDFGKKCQMVHDVEYGDGAVTFISTPEEIYEQTYKTQAHDKQQS